MPKAGDSGGFAMMPHAVSEDSRLSDEAIRLLIALIRHAKGRGTCRPTNAELSTATGGKSPRQLQRTFSALIGLGYVRVEYDKDHRTRGNIELIHPNLAPAIKPEFRSCTYDTSVAPQGTTEVSHPRSAPTTEMSHPRSAPTTEMSHPNGAPTTQMTQGYDRNVVPGTTEMTYPPYRGTRASEKELEKEDIQTEGRESPSAPGSEAPHPAPAEFLALCRRADSLSALRQVAFGPKLRGEWSGRVQAWWETIPRAEVWESALNDLCGQPPQKRTVSYFLGIVKSRRSDPIPTAPARAAPPPIDPDIVEFQRNRPTPKPREAPTR